MTIKITVVPQTPQITIKQTAGGPATNVLTVSTTLSGGSGASRVGQLTDVDSSAPVDGATLVYDSNTQTYVVEQLPASDLSGPVDGGYF